MKGYLSAAFAMDDGITFNLEGRNSTHKWQPFGYPIKGYLSATSILSMGAASRGVSVKHARPARLTTHKWLPSRGTINGYPKKIAVRASTYGSKKGPHKRLPASVPIDDYPTRFQADFP
ncbi:hypothetical protein BTK96_006701 [Burkholderia pyrrocinia]|nr:hypothetical protein [Burkholderia pyrrocinia]